MDLAPQNNRNRIPSIDPPLNRLEDELRKLKAQNEQLMMMRQMKTNNLLPAAPQPPVSNNRMTLSNAQQQPHPPVHINGHSHQQQQQFMTEVPHITYPAGPPPPVPKKPEHLPPTKRITEMVIKLLR